MNFDYAIVGAGAIGSILGAHLARAGHAVVMVARGARAEYLRRHGLQIQGLSRIIIQVPVVDPASLKAVRTLIVATKAQGMHDLLQSLRHVTVTSALSVQNGVQKNDLLAGTFGRDRTLGALANFSGDLHADGQVLFTRNEQFLIGALEGVAEPRSDTVAREIDAAGVHCRAVPGIEVLEWSKFVAWAGLATLSVITRSVSWKFISDPGCASLLARSIREMNSLAVRLGIHISDASMVPVKTLCSLPEAGAVELIRGIGQRYQDGAPDHRMSMLQDLEANRPLEIHETIGHALQRARDAGVHMPVTESLYQLAASIERIQRQMP